MTDDFEDMDDGFEDLVPGGPAKAPCILNIFRRGAGGKAQRMSVVFRMNLIPAEMRAMIEAAPRFAIAVNIAARTIRVRAQADGRYELGNSPGRSTEASDESRRVEFPFPPRGCVFVAMREAITPDYNTEQKAFFIDMPAALFPEPERKMLAPPAPAPPPPRLADPYRAQQRAITIPMAGDPPPGRFARPAVDPSEVEAMRQALGLSETFPRKIGGQHFSKSEAAIIEPLLNHPTASRAALMAATHTDLAVEDDRDEKLIDVQLSQMKQRLAHIGLRVTTVHGVGYKFLLECKVILRKLIEEAKAE